MAWLHHLAKWAADLRPGQVPADVLRTAALQHLSTAAALHAAGAMARPDHDELALAGLVEGLAADEYEDYAFFGHPTFGSVLGAWVAGTDTHHALVATVAANECAGRVGAWTLLQRSPAAARVYVASVAAAVARGVCEGADADALSRALGGVLSEARAIPRSTLHDGADRGAALAGAVVDGWRSLDREGAPMEIASSSAPGQVDCLALLPTRAAELGRSWYTRSLVHRLVPGSPALQSPLRAWREVLRRYHRASGHPLDPAILAGVQIGVDHGALSQCRRDLRPGPYSLPWMVAALATAPDSSASDTADLARRVEVRASPRLTAAWTRHVVRQLRSLRASAPLDDRSLELARPATLVLHTTTGGHWRVMSDDARMGPEPTWESRSGAVVAKYTEHAPGADSEARARLFLDLPPARLADALDLLS